jgi:hypothetical protein
LNFLAETILKGDDMHLGKGLSTAAVLALLTVPLAGVAHASASGGLAQPFSKGQGMFGVSMSYSQRDLHDAPEAQSRKLYFKGAFGFGEGFDGYASLGFSDLKYEETSFSGSLGEFIGLGLRYGGFLLGEGPARLVFDLQWEYFGSEDGDDRVTVDAKHIAAYIVREFGAAGKIGYFYPYAGLRYSMADYSNEDARDYHENHSLGFFGGADYFVNPNVFFSGEMHIFDEESITITAGYRF